MDIKRQQYLDQLIASQRNGLIKIITGIRRCGYGGSQRARQKWQVDQEAVGGGFCGESRKSEILHPVSFRHANIRKRGTGISITIENQGLFQENNHCER